MEWIRFFFGTPRRFLATTTILGMVVVILRPGLLASAVEGLINELMPLLGPAMTIVIVVVSLRMLIGFGRR